MKLSLIKDITGIVIGAGASYGASKIVDAIIDRAVDPESLNVFDRVCVGVAKVAFSGGAGAYASKCVTDMFDKIKIDDEKKTIRIGNCTDEEEQEEAEEAEEQEETDEEPEEV